MWVLDKKFVELLILGHLIRTLIIYEGEDCSMNTVEVESRHRSENVS